jgi:hypothetical protein
MAKKDKEFRLCYVRDNIMYFTDNFENQWSDDWDDAPYEHNAEPPYEWNDNESDEWNVEHHHGHIRKIAFEHHWYIRRPCDGHLNSPYSVEDINKGAIAWLYSEEAGGLMAGSTMAEAIEWCKRAKIKWGELTE